MEKVPHIQVSELYHAPTIQGEGVEIGRPCFFIRLQHCPVQCPGCDTHYTWDGSEEGEKKTLADIFKWAVEKWAQWPGCGFVLSGGEPLIHYTNDDFLRLLLDILHQRDGHLFPWLSLETSGYAGPIKKPGHLGAFLDVFKTVHLSPKVTPCLHGRQTDDELLVNVPLFLRWSEPEPSRLAFKFVVRDQADLDVVLAVDEKFRLSRTRRPIYLMPYGMTSEEILPICEWLATDVLGKYGYLLSPRLHSLIWGRRRGV